VHAAPMMSNVQCQVHDLWKVWRIHSRVNCDSATGSAGAPAVVLTIFLIMKKYSRTLEEESPSP